VKRPGLGSKSQQIRSYSVQKCLIPNSLASVDAFLTSLPILIIMSIYSLRGAIFSMFSPHIIFTVIQKVLCLFAKFSDKEFYERQIARKLGIGYSSANGALNELYSAGVLKRRREGKMYFYSVDHSSPIVLALKKLVNLLLIESLIEELKKASSRIILYGSCAKGTDTSRSDLDLFVVSNNRDRILDIVSSFKFPRGFEEIHIQAVVKTPVELLEVKGSDQAFIEEVEQGIVLWEKAASESRI